MGTTEILRTVVLSVIFGALGVGLAVLLIVRFMRNKMNESDDDEESGSEWIGANKPPASPTVRGEWLEFTREQDGERTPWALPVDRIEYIAKGDDGKAYIACYRVRQKKGFYFNGYDTVESYEEIVKRLKAKKENGK